MIKINKVIVLSVILACIAITLMYVHSFIKIMGGVEKYGGFSEMILYYREGISYGKHEIQEVSEILQQLSKGIKVVSYIFFYVFISWCFLAFS